MTGLAAAAAGKHFGGVVALKDVSIDLKPGEVHGLIGPNGSGKTTMLNLLSGYYKPDEGEILMDGTPLTGQSVQRRARLGVARTFQKPRLLGALSVLDNAMWLRVSSRPPWRSPGRAVRNGRSGPGPRS
jgi:ABC-type branched-subunit amino acid transport system ATPase component